MPSLTKYYLGFRLALTNELMHRTNFLFGVLRRVVFSVTLVYVFERILRGIGAFSSAKLIDYVLVSYFISSIIHAYGMRGISEEITTGDLSNYFVKPLKFLPYWAARMVATRGLLAVAGCVGVVVLALVTRTSTAAFFHVAHPVQTALLVVNAVIMIQLIDFLGGLTAFWTDDEHGVQWLITTLILFLSGALIPNNVLPQAVQNLLNLTPFPLIVYAPTQMWLGNFDAAAFQHAFVTQLVWIVVAACAVCVVWSRGKKMYEAYGR